MPNVTTILDCCHSGYAARDTVLVPKFVELEPRMFRMMGIRTRAEQKEDMLDVTFTVSSFEAR